MSVLHCALIHTITRGVYDVSGTYDSNRIAAQHSSSGIPLQFVHQVRRNVRARTNQMHVPKHFGETKMPISPHIGNDISQIDDAHEVQHAATEYQHFADIYFGSFFLFFLLLPVRSRCFYAKDVFRSYWGCRYCLFSGDKCFFDVHRLEGMWTVRAAEAMMTITFEVGRGCHYCCCSFSFSNKNK